MESVNRDRTPVFSITVEWENASYAELERTRRMLRELRGQLIALNALRQSAHIFFVYDRDIIDSALVQDVIDTEFNPETVPAMTRLIPTEGLRYYEQKNFGAAQADVDINIFLDCDVIPEAGWLSAILEAFKNPDVSVVAGRTYIDARTFYSRAVALFWFFALRDQAEDLVPANSFHANNVGFRAPIFATHPFPDLPTFRGQCVVLAAELRADGIGLYSQRRARVSHPAPLGLRTFVGRALHNGHDEVLVERALRLNRQPGLRRTFRNYGAAIVRSFRNFRRNASAVGLSPIAAVAGYSIAVSYFTLKAAGELVTLMNPQFVPRFIRM